jgi:hypothetical protein
VGPFTAELDRPPRDNSRLLTDIAEFHNQRDEHNRAADRHFFRLVPLLPELARMLDCGRTPIARPVGRVRH